LTIEYIKMYFDEREREKMKERTRGSEREMEFLEER